MNRPLVEILICTLPDRLNFFNELSVEIDRQIFFNHITAGYAHQLFEGTSNSHPEYSIGKKRNELLQGSTGRYICFVDDDDMISKDYVETIYEALMSNPNTDCLSLRGIITTDGENPDIFEHSIKYKKWKDNGNRFDAVRYERYPNHLNVIRADIAKQFKFPETFFGEDYAWSKAIHESGLLKNEVYIDKVLYYYKYRTKK